MRFKRHGDPEKAMRKSPGTATDEDRKRWKREEYQRNKQKYIDRAAIWAEKNKDKVRAYFDKEETKIKVRQRTREWSANNRERKKKADRDWVDKINEYKLINHLCLSPNVGWDGGEASSIGEVDPDVVVDIFRHLQRRFNWFLT
jgi:hypothetical protein